MHEDLDRRSVLRVLAAGGASLTLLGRVAGQAVQGQATSTRPPPVNVAPLSKMAREYDTQPFVFGGVKCLLVRLPAQGQDPRDGRVLLVAQAGATPPLAFTAFTRVCTHLGCTPMLPDDQHHMTCPCHGSVYTADGQVIHGPARRALQAVQLEVRQGDLWATALRPDATTPEGGRP